MTNNLTTGVGAVLRSLLIVMLTALGALGASADDYSATKSISTSNKSKIGSQYSFSSGTLYFTGRPERIRFTLSGSAAYYQNGKNRMSLATFTLKDTNDQALALKESDFTGNNITDFTNLVDGNTNTFCNAAWATAATDNDYFEIALPEGTDLAGGFSFAFVTENTTMNPTMFDVTLYSSTGEVAFAETPTYAFNPTPGVGYAVQLKDNALYLDVQTGVKEPNASYDTKNASLNRIPTKVFFSQDGTGWDILNEAGTYTVIDSKRSWNPAITGSTGFAWTVDMLDANYFTISKSAGNYISMDSPGTGLPLYNNMSTGLQFKLVDYETAYNSVMKKYTIALEGTAEQITISYAGNTYSMNSVITSADEILPDDITASEVSGMFYTVAVAEGVITVTYTAASPESNPAAVTALLDRIGGAGTGSQIETLLDRSLNSKEDVFVISSKEGKPFIKGTTLSALTAGIGWYLNHYLNVNIAWNNLNECGEGAYTTLPAMVVPAEDEMHTSDAQYRYYLNYCTYGYSMATWSTARWMKEIDWMALHGVNMPLAIIGLEQVWKDFLMNDLTECGAKANYTEDEAENFVPGPAFIGWWGMNNLQSWGGDGTDPAAGVHDDAWYARQVALGKAILERERSLGMEPVLPGFCGMVPTNFTSKTGLATEATNKWNNFDRPYIIDPSGEAFPKMAAKYYDRLKAVMGESRYYSMDPFHEWGTISSGKYAEGYKACYDAMNTNCGTNTEWVIQQWDWQSYQKCAITSVPAGRMLVLDLFSDGKPAFDSYNGYAPQKAIYCIIPNFGGRSGLMGRLESVAGNYFSNKAKYSTIQGVGAAPEAIEQTPVTYDLLFELPWLGAKPDVATWASSYAKARYGQENANTQEAWNELRQSALAYGTDGVQGPIEDVWAARPNLNCEPASHWGKTISNVSGTYTEAKRQMVIDAASKLIDASLELTDNRNLDYDIIEVEGQALADYAYSLLSKINEARNAGDTELCKSRSNAFLGLILDVDRLKGTNTNFRLGKWTQEARSAALEATGATTATPDWYEQANARTLITTWGARATSENTPLHEYSYRSWQGMLKDFYYPRWKYYFDNNCTNPSEGWFTHDWNWAHSSNSYSPTAEGNTAEIGREIFNRYFVCSVDSEGNITYRYQYIDVYPTGIKSVSTQSSSNNRRGYTLSGQQIDEAKLHGVYVTGGRKVIKK